MSEFKIENMNGVNVVNAPADIDKTNVKAEDTLKDTPKSTEETAPKNESKATDKHVVTYIGSSEYIDSTGHKWHKNDEKTYSNDEYAKRNDLHFMIKYGEMKHTVVTM